MELPEDLLLQAIERGDIIHGQVFADIDHGKFFVVLAVSGGEVGYFFINSNVNRWKARNPELNSLQFPIKRSDYPFLEYQSFIDCTEIRKMSVQAFTKHMQNQRCRKVAKLKNEDFNLIIEATQNSKLFSKADKRNFLHPSIQ